MNAPDKPPGVKLLLIVDDDPASIALMQLHLAPLGHRLVCASDEQRAMALFDAELPDLVLLDFVMPGIGGLGVLAHIRTRAYTIHVPVILVTMYSEREHRLLGLQAGADEFLEKPIDGAILLTRVNSLLALRESQDELRASRDFAAARALLLERLQREQRELTQFIVHDLKSQLSVVLLR
jgi:two-component system phosphate regulon response regulator PhoB